MKLRKNFSFFIALLVLVSNSGLAFSVHYCGEKIASISSVFSNDEVCEMPVLDEKACCAKSENTTKGCCSDKKISLKNKAEQVVIKNSILDIEAACFFVYTPQILADMKMSFSSNENAVFYCQSNAPPLYKLYCQYTFYS